MVVAAVIARGDAVLVAQRPRGKRHGGLWEFPGGKVRQGESPAQAITRELHEELDLETERVGDRLFISRDAASGLDIHFYEVDVIGDPRAVEHEDVRWALRTEVRLLPLAPADRRFALTAL